MCMVLQSLLRQVTKNTHTVSFHAAACQVRQNAVRALGSFGRLYGASPSAREPTNPAALEDHMHGLRVAENPSGDWHLLGQAVEALAYNITHGSVKVCSGCAHPTIGAYSRLQSG
jgi:hypothetical protein